MTNSFHKHFKKKTQKPFITQKKDKIKFCDKHSRAQLRTMCAHDISTSKTVLTKEKYLSAMKLLKEDGLEKNYWEEQFYKQSSKV